MRNLIYYSFALLLFAAFTFAGCQKKETIKLKQLPVAKCKKELTIVSKDNISTFVVEVGASDNALLSMVNAEDIVLSTNVSENIQENIQDNETDVNSQESNKDSQFIFVKIKSIATTQSIENYNISFSNTVKEIINREGIGVVLDFESPNIISIKANVETTFAFCCKGVTITNNNPISWWDNVKPCAYYDLYWASTCSATQTTLKFSNQKVCNYTYLSVCISGANSSKYWRTLISSHVISCTVSANC